MKKFSTGAPVAWVGSWAATWLVSCSGQVNERGQAMHLNRTWPRRTRMMLNFRELTTAGRTPYRARS